MEVVRAYVDAKQLRSVVSLPKTFADRKLEIIVIPIEDKKETLPIKSEVVDAVDALIGVIPDKGMELLDYRAERLEKYEAAD